MEKIQQKQGLYRIVSRNKFTIKKERNSIDEHIAKEIIRRHKQLAKYSEEKDNE